LHVQDDIGLNNRLETHFRYLHPVVARWNVGNYVNSFIIRLSVELHTGRIVHHDNFSARNRGSRRSVTIPLIVPVGDCAAQ